MKPYRGYAIAVTMLCSGLLVTVSAGAASLQMVSQSEWAVDDLPSYVNMYIYIPDNLATKPPIVVAPHHRFWYWW